MNFGNEILRIFFIVFFDHSTMKKMHASTLQCDIGGDFIVKMLGVFLWHGASHNQHHVLFFFE